MDASQTSALSSQQSFKIMKPPPVTLSTAHFLVKKSKLNPIKELIPAIIPKKQRLPEPPKLGSPGNQIIGGDCVGQSIRNYLNCSPHPYNLPVDFGIDLWKWAKSHDGDPDTDPKNNDDGTYVVTGLKRLKQLKYIEPSFNSKALYLEKDLRVHLQIKGPAILSLEWYDDFDVPTQGSRGHGFIELWDDSVLRGGHALIDFWYDERLDRHWLYQAWQGYSPYDIYGQIVEMPQASMKRLFNRGAWAIAPVKFPKP